MKILVTGHLGYIGTVLTPMLLERGHDVVGLDSDLFAACTFAGISWPGSTVISSPSAFRTKSCGARKGSRQAGSSFS